MKRFNKRAAVAVGAIIAGLGVIFTLLLGSPDSDQERMEAQQSGEAVREQAPGWDGKQEPAPNAPPEDSLAPPQHQEVPVKEGS